MRKKQRLKELTIKDNFMFGAVMINEDNCKGLLERVLEIPIERVDVSKEKSMVYHPEYKGVRLDVYAKDEKQTRYNVEMQVEKKPALGKRSCYYQSQMDMEMLLAGEDYKELPNTYVIFICNFDPLEQKKCRYTIRRYCEETGNVFGDGVCTVFLNTNGENREEVPKELTSLLDFVKADLAGSEADYGDALVKQLQDSMRQIKKSRKMGERYMMFEQYMKEYVQEHADEIREEAWAEGLAEGHAEGLQKGRAEGLQEGRAEGLQKGRAEATTRLNKLYSCLLTSDRADDLQRALKDPVYLKQLLQEFGF